MPRIAIIGSRNWCNLPRITDKLQDLKDVYGDDLTIVSGGARGVDKIAETWAKAHGVKTHIIPVKEEDWKRDGKIAGHYRNAKIIDAAQFVIAFWHWPSGGTANGIAYATYRKKPVEVYIEHAPPERRRLLMLIFTKDNTINTDRIVVICIEKMTEQVYFLQAYTHYNHYWVIESGPKEDMEYLRDCLTLAWAKGDKLFSVPDVMALREEQGAYSVRTEAGGLEL